MLVRESEQRYRSIGRLTAAVWTCTPHGQLTYLSDGFKKLFGYSAEDRDGKKWLEIIGISPTERGLEKVLSDWKKCNESGAVWNHTFTARDRSGKDRPMIARVAAVKDDGDEITSWVGVNIDATELQEMTRPCIESPQ
ncbi:MAG TPA: PAS domain-containing protein [Desulfomonilaceae bacterium]|nr:PAS domain-containing protein [Desulfomonilaceae bacterium]